MTPPLARSHPLVVIGASFGGVGAGWRSAWCELDDGTAGLAAIKLCGRGRRPLRSAAGHRAPAVAPGCPASRDAPPETLREHCGGALSEVRSGRPAWPS